MAAGSAGTWFTVGYLSYITVGVIAVAVTALFYQHFEVNLGEPYTGTLSNYLAWTHLILMNVGVTTAAALLMYGGYFGGAALLPVAEGGLGETTEWVHRNILSQLINPIGYSIIVAGFGVLSGGLGFLINHLKR